MRQFSRTVAAVAGVCILATAALAEKKPYTLADLKALIASKSYQEAIAHLGDISPSERKDEWLEIAVTATTGYLDGLKDENHYSKTMMTEAIETEFPVLLKSPKYIKVRTEVGLKGFGECFKSSYRYEDCVTKAIKFVKADPGADLALKLAKLARPESAAYNSIPLFKVAVDLGGNRPTICKDGDLEQAVMAGLALPQDYANAEGARSIASGACWDHLKKAILVAFKDSSEGGYVHQNTCEFLLAKKALTKEQAKICAGL